MAELAVKHDLLRALGRNLRAHHLRRDDYISMMSYPGMAGAHADHRRLLQELCHDGVASGLATCAPPRHCPALELLAVNTYTCVAEFTQYAAIEALRDPTAQHRGWSANSPAGASSLFATEPGARFPLRRRPRAPSTPG